MSHLELPCARCGHKLVAVSAKGLSDAVWEHKKYHRWLDNQETRRMELAESLMDALAPLAGLLERPR